MTSDYTSTEQAVWDCLARLCPHVQSRERNGVLEIVITLPEGERAQLKQMLRERIGSQELARIMRQ